MAKPESPISFAAAAVLYRSTLVELDALLEPFEAEGTAIYLFANGPLDMPIERRLERSSAIVLRSPDNRGLGHALNALMAAAEADKYGAVMLLDQDSAPPTGLIHNLSAARVRLPERTAAIGPRLVSPENESYLEPWYARRGPAQLDLTPVDYLPTSGTLVPIKAWKTVGPFRADFFIDGIDVEWCFRAWSMGFGCYVAERLSMPHRWGKVSDGNNRQPQILRQSLLRSYYYLRNSLAAMRLAHLPLRWRLRSVARLCLQSCLLVTYHPSKRRAARVVLSAVVDGWKGRLGPAPSGRMDDRPSPSMR